MGEKQTEVKTTLDTMSEVKAIEDCLNVLSAKLRAIPKDNFNGQTVDMYVKVLSRLQALPQELTLLGISIEVFAGMAKKKNEGGA